ncbi:MULTISPECIES: tyrosine-type recombinase/integrase [Butyricimonas]|uniref:tyrosine-type recombinase/integrase n=1 Tax=Butyricimonas TaxID=574697 RepID=UPI0009F644F7|nr:MULTISPECIES: tyrosine-type recombinase/integrase [Butyricimonas]
METIKDTGNINSALFNNGVSDHTIIGMINSGMLPEEINDIDVFKREWRKTFTGSFLLKYPRYYGIINTIRRIVGRLPEWDDFTRQNIRDISEYFKNNCCGSSARTYTAMIRSVLNYNREIANIPCKDFENELRVKNEPHVAIYLTVDELCKLERFKPENEREEVILAQFLVGCYTGARHSDILCMNEDNIQGKYITYVSKKTKIPATIELKKGLPKLLEIAVTREYAESTFNDTIKDICRKAGIDSKVKVFKAGKSLTGHKYQFVSSHTARRSFASNLAILGVPIREIQLRMGHSSTTMTERYILAPVNKLPESAREYFK